MNELPDSESKLIAALQQRDALLGAVAYSARELLLTADWASRMNVILSRLGQASDSSRVYVFQHEKDQGKLLTNLVFEWCAPGIAPQINNPDLQKMEIGAVGFSRWIEFMGKGESIYGAVHTFPEDEQQLLESQEIKSLVVIPFFVSGLWWGFIGFDQCDRVRDWSPAEIEALQAAANMIGSAIERREAEERLKMQYEELQKTNHELDFFVYSVSHDLRAPLASILGLVNVAEMENGSPNLKEYHTRIRTSVAKLDSFIKEILDYSRNSRIKIVPGKIDFNILIDEVCQRVIPADMQQFFKVTIHIDGDAFFYSDKKRLDVIFNNLMSNAVKFRDISKEQTIITIDIQTSQEGASIRFGDNGIGIDPEHVEKVFNMFYRATEQSNGSGLGLYIAREVVNKLGGTITVKSVVAESTAVELWIPNIFNKR